MLPFHSLSIPNQFWSRNAIDSDLGTPSFLKKIEKKSKSLQVQDYPCLQCHGLYSVNISKLSNARCFCFEIAGQLDLWYWNAFSKTAISNSKYLSIIWWTWCWFQTRFEIAVISHIPSQNPHLLKQALDQMFFVFVPIVLVMMLWTTKKQLISCRDIWIPSEQLHWVE